MSKQVYIDENGNEVLVSGTVNTADMMPMSGGDSTKVSEAIGDLTTLTTSDKSSIVGAVNEVNGKTAITKRTYTTPNALNIGANTIDTQTITISDAVYGIVVGFAITNNTDVVIMQCYFNGLTELNVRVRNVSASAGTYRFSIIYI